jgi:uncharacterized small protein (DUF1192 family)
MENRYVVIENDPTYVKDMYTSAILNNDINSVVSYKQKKKTLNQIAIMQDEINMLKEELQKIKNHLQLS